MDGTETGRLLSGRYRLDTVIGRGGMGVVWQARDEVLKRDVAMKEIIWPPHLTESEQQVACQRAFREAQIASRLSHLNVVRIYDILEEDGHPWIIMELLPYRSVRDLVIEEGPLPPARTARIGLGVLAALRAAHAEGILHRDVKPANILVSPEGRVVLTDFGIARAADSPTLTGAGLIGSPSYTAPERARGEPAGAPADMWGLGASLYAAVEGHPPFERNGALQTLTAVVADELPRASLAGPLWPVISGLLRKDPEKRLTADDAERMLARVAADGGFRHVISKSWGRKAAPAAAAALAADPILAPRPAESGPAESGLAGPGLAEPGLAGPGLAEPGLAEPGLAEPSRGQDTQPAVTELEPAGLTGPDPVATPWPVPDPAATGPEAGLDPGATSSSAPPTTPELAATPETYGTPETSGTPEISETPESAVTLESAVAPDTAATPLPLDTPETVDTLGPVFAPESLDTPVPDEAQEPVATAEPVGAPEPDDAPVVAPALARLAASPAPAPTGPRRSRRSLAGVAALTVVAAAITAVALILTGSPPHQSAASGRTSSPAARPSVSPRAPVQSGPAPSASPAPHASASASPAGSPRTSAASAPASSPAGSPGSSAAPYGALPAGYYRFTNSTGFSIGVPNGWAISHVGHYVYISDPSDGNIFLLIDQSDQPKPNPLADWEQQQANRAGTYPGYHLIRLDAVYYPQAEKAADWEFTYVRNGLDVQILNRNILANAHHAYALYWSVPESEWGSSYHYFQAFAATFRPAPASDH